MKETPILFTGEMVRAILDGRKTQTRRAVKLPVKDRNGTGCEIAGCELNSCLNQGIEICPYGKPGDRLWVRETFHPEPSHKGPASYRATWPKDDEPPDEGWKPSIFMPRWACRLTLEITEVSVQRLQDITQDDAIAEGTRCWVCYGPVDGTSENDCQCFHTKSAAVESYRVLWDSINLKRGFGWDKNPWVWAITFEAVEKLALRREFERRG